MPFYQTAMSAIFSKPFNHVCSMHLVRYPEDQPYEKPLQYRMIGTLFYLHDGDMFYQFDMDKIYVRMSEALANKVINLFEYNQYKTIIQLLELGFQFPANEFMVWNFEQDMMMCLEMFFFTYAPNPTKWEHIEEFYTLPDMDSISTWTEGATNGAKYDTFDDLSDITPIDWCVDDADEAKYDVVDV